MDGAQLRLSNGLAMAALGLVLCVSTLHARQERGLTEQQLLREASALETRGEFLAAENRLRSVLERMPASLTAILQIERVMVAGGRVAALAALADTLLATDPKSVIVHQVAVRAHALLDSADGIERSGEAWIAAMPNLEVPYRELARIWRQRGELERAIEILERGKTRIDRGDALALELGDAYADAMVPSRAIAEWDRAIGRDGRGFLAVQRRLRSLPDGGAALIPDFVEALVTDPTTSARRRSAAILAIDAGLAVRAQEIAAVVARRLNDRERRTFLLDVARRADGAGLAGPAYWAYGELVRGGGRRSETLALRSRMAELALVVGDTAGAAAAYSELERASLRGSPEWRQARAIRIQLAIHEGEHERALEDLTLFRAEDPDAPQLGRTAAALANALLDIGDLNGAVTALHDMSGADVRVARARIHVLSGDVTRARVELLTAAPSLRGTEATDAIALASLFGRLSVEGADLVGSATALGTDARARSAAVDRLVEESLGLAPEERAAILAYAADLAARAGLWEAADEARRELVADHPAAPEAPAALLALARSLELHGSSAETVRLLLVQLITDYPRSALIPQARRALDRMQIPLARD
jgi:tetratricopeptide (TPR) repeat protein